MTAARRRTTLAATAALTLGLTLSACSGAEDAGSTVEEGVDAAEERAAHNDADTEFAQMMIVHHEGAVEMAELAVEKADSDEVRALGERIAAAQQPEIDLMSGWLEAWGEEAPDDADMGGMDHGAMEMDGLDPEEVMAELGGLEGAEFDERFLELMVDHHQGAIDMAEELQDEGESTEARQLAEKIVGDQTEEIAEMQELLENA